MPDLIRVFNRGSTDLLFIEGDTEAFLERNRWTEVPSALVYHYLAGPEIQNLIIDVGPEMIPHPDMQPWPALLFAGPISGFLGYGNLSRNLIAGLKDKCDLYYFNLGHKKEFDIPLDVWGIIEKPFKAFEWSLGSAIPHELPRVPAMRRILFSMWEMSTIPKGHLGEEPTIGGWAGLVNKWAEALIVPCQAQKESWAEGGVIKPIHVVPLGVDFDIFTYCERPSRPDKPFTIVLYGWLTSRKSPIETLTNVCWRALVDKEDWRLILKSHSGTFGGRQSTPVISDERVTMINEPYTAQQLASLLHEADVGIALSKYEGFGLPFREMMATGLPVIVSANSGHLEDCNPGYNIPIPTHHWERAEQYGDGSWAIPDWDEAATALLQIYNEWKQGGCRQLDMGRRAARWIRRRRSWDKTIEGVLGVLEEHING